MLSWSFVPAWALSTTCTATTRSFPRRHDEILFPERLDDDMAADHPVRFLDAFVDARALAACGFHRAMPAATGRPGSAPGDLLQLSLYGSLYRLRARRRLEQATHRHSAWLWRWQKLRPDHKTIADFRTHNLRPLRQVCRTLHSAVQAAATSSVRN